MAFSVIVFVTNDFVKTKEFHNIINHAVKKNKEILTIYLEEVELDAWGHMQLDSLQYLNVSQNDFDSKLLEASIFKDMKVTDAQKRFQRRTTITAITTPILAGILAFFLIIEPLLIAPTRINSDTLGLNGLTQEELDSITELYIMGDQVYKHEDITKVHCWPQNGNKNNVLGQITRTRPDGSWYDDNNTITVNRGTISNISDLSKLRNLKTGSIVEDTAIDMIDKMVDDDSVLISVYYGEDVSEEEADKMSSLISDKYPDLDIEFAMGGQAVYYYLLSVE